jgi:hypothetical protein
MHRPEWPGGRDFGPYSTAILVPEYTSDLNAMHEAEKTLTREERRQWELEIANMFSGPGQSWFDVCHMSADKRAELFLRTKGLWTA